MERIKISPYARRTAKELGVDVSDLVGTGPNGRIVFRDVDEASHKPAPTESAVGCAAGLYTSADVTELLAALGTLNGALTLSSFADRAAQKLAAFPVSVRDFGPDIEGGIPCLRGGETAVVGFGVPVENRLRLHLAYAPAAVDDQTAAEFLRALRAALENPLSLLV